MAVTIIYKLECHCGGDATARILNLDDPRPNGSIVVDVELAVGQQTFECDECGCSLFTGDLDYEVEDSSCSKPSDDGET